MIICLRGTFEFAFNFPLIVVIHFKFYKGGLTCPKILIPVKLKKWGLAHGSKYAGLQPTK